MRSVRSEGRDAQILARNLTFKRDGKTMENRIWSRLDPTAVLSWVCQLGRSEDGDLDLTPEAGFCYSRGWPGAEMR